MKTIDFHSHILPGMDDGCKTLSESVAVLEMLSGQGVGVVAATPHFHINRETVEEFKHRRAYSYSALQREMCSAAPEIKLGAEVRYYEGISRLPGLQDLCLEGTNFLLLEMPMGKWTEAWVQELIRMSCSGAVSVILAHVERYLKDQSCAVWQRLTEEGVLLQANATFFLNTFTRRKAFSMLRKGWIHVVGSDCHNLTDRAPRIGKALGLIRKKYGEEFLRNMLNCEGL